jgi:hypothetical protein
VTVFCLNLQRQAVATTDHLGRTTCECGEPVRPVVILRRRKGPAR